MKRFTVWMLVLSLVLSGCGRDTGSQPDDRAETTVRPTAAPGTTPPPQEPQSALLASGLAVEGQENLLYIPNSEIEQLMYPQLFAMDDAMLVSCIHYQGEGDTTEHTLMTLDLLTGECLGRLQKTSFSSTMAMAQGDWVALMDYDAQTLTLYDKYLNQTAQYSAQVDWADWYLSPDASRLYYAPWDGGLTVMDLATGALRDAIPDTASCAVWDSDGKRLLVEYVDVASQRSVNAFLDMTTGETQSVTLEGNVSGGTFCGEYFVLNDHLDYLTSHLLTPEGHGVLTLHADALVQLDQGGHLLMAHDNTLVLYGPTGKFLTSSHLPQGEAVNLFEGLAWCGQLGGYFFTSQTLEGNAKLYFWTPSESGQGTDLPVRDYEDTVPGGHAAAPMVYEKARALSEKYGLDIRIADQCQLDYDEYYSYAVTDTQVLSDALDALERALAAYPEDYFRQLLYGRLKTIRIELVAGLQKKEMPPDAAFTEFVAFAQERGSYYLVVADIYTTYEESYYHEFSHITDRRLEWDAQLRPGALYSEDGWLALQPEGFEFSYSYDTLPWDVGSSRYDGWFVDAYSCTFPTEDRARTMEYAMVGWYWPFESAPMRAKLDYYSRCIRDCFDTSGWPEITTWEKPLHE